jgi:hypothetical protein
MTSRLVEIITSPSHAVRNQSLDAICQSLSFDELQSECAALEQFRKQSSNLYERVRALFFLYAIHAFHLPHKATSATSAIQHTLSYDGYRLALNRNFEGAISIFLQQQARAYSTSVSSALAQTYRDLAFATLADQVKHSVRHSHGNTWMFNTRDLSELKLRLHPDLMRGATLREQTPVRMDVSHSGWSDIFFLGMDFPEGARVINISIDLGVHGRDAQPQPPVEVTLRVIDEPILKLSSADLHASATLTHVSDAFDFARDYLGLLKAGVIASGLIPSSFEGKDISMRDLLGALVGEGKGLEITTHVRDIPKGSRLAVSTSLLCGIIAACMRATQQTHALTGELSDDERRLIASRAILGEWLGGSGGGWQDSGGMWPAAKLITGVAARAGDPEFDVSRGCLLPQHTLITLQRDGINIAQQLQDSLILVHGGMAQNVGPILEMVTEKYLLRSEPEWSARQEAMRIFDQIVQTLQHETHVAQSLSALTTQNFFGPIQTIIPAANNAFTQTVVNRVRAEYGADFWGFWMLGGMSGGGMGFLVAPTRKAHAMQRIGEIMRETKREMQAALPFAMEPVVYDFAINPHGSVATLAPARMDEVKTGKQEDASEPKSAIQNQKFEIDLVEHERIRADMRAGKIGLAQNCLSLDTKIEDVRDDDLIDLSQRDELEHIGRAAIKRGEVGILTLAAGAGSRWTQGAGVAKALHPFFKHHAQFHSFLDIHRAKTQRTQRNYGARVPHIIATGYLTHGAIQQWQTQHGDDALYLSNGRSVGLRFIPMARDLRFAFDEASKHKLDERKQKVRESAHQALIEWARAAGEGGDYTDNLPSQCVHPIGHWYEFGNLLRNGTLLRVLETQPQLRTLMLHNLDTVGANIDAALLGAHMQSSNALTFEVVTRHIEDRGGGLARIDGLVRLIEGLALPRDEDEFKLRFYNSMTTWIDIDRLLAVFELRRSDLSDAAKVDAAVRALAARMPTYITLKDVKKRWGNGQEDVYPVAQFEKLWSDLSTLPEVRCGYVVVPRIRGQQLKDIAQLDRWLRDGSADYVAELCGF